MEKKRGGGSMMLQNCMKRRRRSTRAKPLPSLCSLSLSQNILCFKTRLDYRVFTPTVKGENIARHKKIRQGRLDEAESAYMCVRQSCAAMDHIGTFNARVLTIQRCINFEKMEWSPSNICANTIYPILPGWEEARSIGRLTSNQTDLT